MRYDFFICLVAASLLAVSCQKNGRPVEAAERKAISFGLSGVLAETHTKAYSENTAARVQANGFNVAGINGATVMFNEKVIFAASKYSPVNGPYYYPASGSMDFYAVYPISQSVSVSSGAASVEYAQDPDADLLVASRMGVTSSSNSVALAFDHALSLIKFKAVGADTKVIYKLKSIAVVAPTTGTYAYSTGTWTAGKNFSDYVYSSATTQLSAVTDIAGALTVIPCTPTVKVEYDTYFPDGTTLIQSYSKSGSLGSVLAKGKECTVTLTLPNGGASEVSFTVTVNPWGLESRSVDF